MASTLSSPLDCCTTCNEPVQINVPGPPGADGAPCTPCTDGLNAFSTIVGGATLVPAYGATANVELAGPEGSLWVGQSQTLYVQSFGYFRVDAIPDTTHVTLFNLGYAGNVNGNGILTFTAGTRVQPGGLEGPSGSTAGAFLVANNLSEGVPATMRTNLGLGTAATAAEGDFFEVANNLSEGVAATKRTNLGLGSAAVLDAGVTNTKLPPIDATFTNGDVVFATATGLQTKSVANTLLALGIGPLAIVTKTASYGLLTTDDVVLCDALVSSITIGLPQASTVTGKVYTIKRIDVSANPVTVDGFLGELIDGAAAQSLLSQWDSITIVSNGTAWYII